MKQQPPPADREHQSRHLDELEQRFGQLFAELNDSPQKEAISILHGMMHELQREWHRTTMRATGGQGPTIADLASLYEQAPKMEGEARSVPLAPGTKAPDFALPDHAGRTIRLSDFRGQPVVLAFYPLDWSPGCSQQLDLYQHDIDEFERRRARLVGISVDSIYCHGAWAAVRGLSFPLLADFHPKGAVARAYQVYRDDLGYSDRAVYVIDHEGVIRDSVVSPFLHHVPDVHELFAALDRIGTGARDSAGVRS